MAYTIPRHQVSLYLEPELYALVMTAKPDGISATKWYHQLLRLGLANLAKVAADDDAPQRRPDTWPDAPRRGGKP
jgi:hypothetical protein